jgi:elongator complex protein 3
MGCSLARAGPSWGLLAACRGIVVDLRYTRRMSAAVPAPDCATRTAGRHALGDRDRDRGFDFDPSEHRDALCALIGEIEALVLASPDGEPLLPAALHRILRRHPRQGRGLFSHSELIAGYRAFASTQGFRLDEAGFLKHVQMRPVRTQSGVTPVTVLTKPYPCPGQCVFCPNDVRMPKSYLSVEPGCQRAEANGFDPYLQTYQRLLAFRAIGHPTDKVELIVLGGTFSYYPESYRIWFIKRCYDALNDFALGRDECAAAQAQRLSVAEQSLRLDGRRLGAGYNRAVTQFLRPSSGPALLRDFEHASFDELRKAHARNETARTRNVGLVLETRPDHIDEAELLCLRRLGCTKVQIGYQSLSDEILLRNKRGHDVAATRRAMFLLRQAGFKILAHIMPNLLGATPESDVADLARAFEDPDFRPDELKVYPCSLVESAELMRHYEDGSFRPYEYDELLRVLTELLLRTPRYCRLSRVIRDISSADIVAGNRRSNFREIAERTLRARGERVVEIRSREIRHGRVIGPSVLRTTAYATSVGEERFIEFVTEDDRILGFCRLSLPRVASFVPELLHSALLRELHVYGASLSLGEQPGDQAQHRGFGGRLIDEAARQAARAGYGDLAVISAIGTRLYYRERGFGDGPLYQHRPLALAVGP